MRRWDGLLDRYTAECVTRGLSEATIAGRRRELERFGAWLKRRRPRPSLEAVDCELITGYIQSRKSFRSRASVASAISHLRNMGDFLVRANVWISNPLRWMRGPKIDPRHRLPRRVGKGQLEKLWAAASERREVHARYQAMCVLALFYGTGLRRGELLRLSLKSWCRDEAVLLVDGRKTGQPRKLPVGAAVWRCIEAYLPHRHNLLENNGQLDEDALLLSRNGTRLSEASISNLIKRLAKDAGVSRITLHQLRHSCASDLLESGVPLPQVQRILGHACLATTMRYVDITDPDRAHAIAQHPLNDFLACDERIAS